ncbi:hypothetical protein TWF718_003469 [Orbilia javanica]|uniref:Uncharacterized protein n=1 Tax=Orbilia javanica TaxID=47235 RepID=A0AAN8RA62_9PEZI
MSDTPFRLFDLPPEIREIIYSHLVDISQEPLEPDLKTQLLSPAPATSFNYTHRPPGRFVISHVALSIYYPTAPLGYSLLPVLQACSQLRSDFQRYISFLQRKPSGHRNPLGYTLDAKSYRTEMFLKWTRLQLPPEIPYNIIPEFRINYKVMNLMRRYQDVLRFYSYGALLDEGLGLFNLLSDLLNHGPQGFYIPSINDGDGGGRCAAVFIQKLVLNVEFEYSQALNDRFDHLASTLLRNEPGPTAAADLFELTVDMENFKSSIVKGFGDWMSRFIEYGHLDGVVGTVQILYNGAEEFTVTARLDDLGKTAPPTKIVALLEVPGKERRENIIEPEDWENRVWGRKEKFRVHNHGPFWADRWVNVDGAWVPPSEVPQAAAPPPPASSAVAAKNSSSEVDIFQRLQDEVDEALEHYEGRQDGPAAE